MLPPKLINVLYPVERQDKDNWCWAAVSDFAAKYLTLLGKGQCNIATACLPLACGNGCSATCCDVPHELSNAMAKTGHPVKWSESISTELAIKKDIDANKMVGVRIEWPDKTGHFVAICGYDTPAIGGLRYWVYDPAKGDLLTVSRTTLSESYQGIGRWTHTYHLA